MLGSPIAAAVADVPELDETVEAPSVTVATTAATGCGEFAAGDPWLRAAATAFASVAVLSLLEAAFAELVLVDGAADACVPLRETTSAAASVPGVAGTPGAVAWLFALAGITVAEGGALAFGFVGALFVDFAPAAGVFDPALVVVAGRDRAACALLAVEPAIVAVPAVPAVNLTPCSVLEVRSRTLL